MNRDVTPTSQAREMVRVFGCLTDWFPVSHAYMLTVLNIYLTTYMTIILTLIYENRKAKNRTGNFIDWKI